MKTQHNTNTERESEQIQHCSFLCNIFHSQPWLQSFYSSLSSFLIWLLLDLPWLLSREEAPWVFSFQFTLSFSLNPKEKSGFDKNHVINWPLLDKKIFFFLFLDCWWNEKIWAKLESLIFYVSFYELKFENLMLGAFFFFVHFIEFPVCSDVGIPRSVYCWKCSLSSNSLWMWYWMKFTKLKYLQSFCVSVTFFLGCLHSKTWQILNFFSLGWRSSALMS